MHPDLQEILHNITTRLAKLEKKQEPMNTEIWTVCNSCNQRVTGDSIHTCSPQLKPLSDEEIRKIAIQCDAYDNDGSLITDDICIDKFARAIEERHGIK